MTAALIDFAALFLFVGMLGCTELGRRLGARPGAKDAEGGAKGLGSIEGAIFALFGLLLAFTFSGAASRFDQRRDLILQEANDLGTAWLRLDALPAATQPPLRDLMRRYVDGRLAAYAMVHEHGPTKALAALAEANALQGPIWTQAVAACAAPEGQRVTMLVLPALNAAFDTAEARSAVTRFHPPAAIFVLLFVLALLCAVLVGWGLAGAASPHLLHRLAFAAVVALTVGVTLDIEYPRLGFIRVDAADQMLVDLRASWR